MAELMRMEIYSVRRDIRKYILRNLHQDHGLLLPNSRHLQREVAVIIGTHLLDVRSHTLESSRGVTLHVTVRDLALKDLDHRAGKQLHELATSAYHDEFHELVDNLHYFLRVPINKAVESFRTMYGITEDDFPLEASLRNYRRYQRHMGRAHKRGRSRLPFELLKDGRQRDMHDQREHLGDAPQS